ncbi:metal-dependent hydrolase [Elongatibacter sediminis]|uniref:Metal-dependent hydrolase n=1 Tax=Elongatibacter sediminis TaxID=3119006 RepID=A0AAW9R6G9_9GAMM
MDSITQAALGAVIGGVCVPAPQRRLGLAAGAVLGTLPDLDVLIDYGDAVANFTRHRGFSHSLLVLAPFSVSLWLLLRRWWAPVRSAPRHWLAAISLVLLSHPLLDAHTAYGTQLFWPLDTPPVSWSTLFIIDPLYTLPLLAAVLVAVFRPRAARTTRVMGAALVLSTAYIGWSWVAKSLVQQELDKALALHGLHNRPVFTTPTYFNTLLWRVVVLDGDGYLEGFDSLLIEEAELHLQRHDSDTAALQAATEVAAVSRLQWFARGFNRARVDGDLLLITDLRMGQEPYYAFTHVAARRGNPHWTPVVTETRQPAYPSSLLNLTWRRIFSE